MRTPLIMANWKMHKTMAEACDFATALQATDLLTLPCEVSVCAPTIHLATLDAMKLPFSLGIQNFYPAASGAFTGETALDMLQGMDIVYALVGHSERRSVFGEPDGLIAEKFAYATSYGITPVLCVGESLAVREQGQANAHCSEQLHAAFSDLTATQLPDNLVLAYEPVWAIGTGQTATAEDAQDMCRHLRQVMAERFDAETAARTRILYGGSVKPDNIEALLASPDIDGALVGGASLVAEDFYQLVAKGSAACQPR